MLRSLHLNINCVELLANDDKQRCLILNALIKKIFKTVATILRNILACYAQYCSYL